MKIYVIYDTTITEHPEMNDAPGPLGETSYMVAYSDKKEYAEEYMEYRKKKVFKMKTYKMSKSEFTMFRNQNAMRELRYFELTTRTDEYKTHITEINVIMTPAEHHTLEDMGVYFGCEHISFHDVRLFKKKYARALGLLEYSNMQRLILSHHETCGMDYDLPNAFFDELSGFVFLHSEEFKG